MAGRPRWVWGAAIVAIVVLLAGVVAVVTRRDDDSQAHAVETPTSSSSSTTTTSSTSTTTTTTTTLPPPPETTAPAPPPTTVAASGPSAPGSDEPVAPAEPAPPRHRVYTYSVIVDGAVNGSVGELAAKAQQVWNDDRSWHATGLDFVEVSGGGTFTLVLANPFEVPKYAPGTCDAEYSCTNGGFVVINDDRWTGGSGNWAGSLDEYRTMVLNHEVGHELGLGHQFCSGGLAPVMQQQSISLQGCAPNPWPLEWELDQVR